MTGKPALTALVVDVEVMVTRTLSIILQQKGFAVTPAYSGEEAVELARRNPPDRLVCDIVMGAMNGIEAAVKIQSLSPQCRVILISGNSAAAELLDVFRTPGFIFEILAKPFDPDVLISKMSA